MGKGAAADVIDLEAFRQRKREEKRAEERARSHAPPVVVPVYVWCVALWTPVFV